MIDTTDLTNLKSAFRELKEEIGVPSYGFQFAEKLGEFLVGDKGRYDKLTSKHRLKSYLYSFEINEKGIVDLKPGDDAKELHQIKVSQLYDLGWVTENILPTHIPMLFTWLAKQKRTI